MTQDWHTKPGPDGSANTLVREARTAIFKLIRSECSAIEAHNGLMYIRDACNEAMSRLDEKVETFTAIAGVLTFTGRAGADSREKEEPK